MVKGYRPDSLQEALEIKSDHATSIIAGGTDLMVQKARGTGLKPGLKNNPLFISHIPELRKFETSDKFIRIGACLTLSELVEKGELPTPLLNAIDEIASIPLRNIATMGGNICNASPAGDTLPYLYAADARLLLQSIHEERVITLDEFIYGPGQITLESGEILTDIIIDNKAYDFNFYKKVGTSKGMALSKLSFTGLVNFDGDKISEFRAAFGAVGPTVVHSPKIEDKVTGIKIENLSDIAPEIENEYRKIISPIDDSRSTREYRLETSLRIFHNFLEEISNY